ncbi:hypothetical protein [Burkholderia ubonensis]|uniref:hypothetical protein n=1 Tax=Burkholderia ubonensis TaxID=101571 RepID=UPI00105611C0|nr:hypothetical protein [Burkholderia ubonensis]
MMGSSRAGSFVDGGTARALATAFADRRQPLKRHHNGEAIKPHVAGTVAAGRRDRSHRFVKAVVPPSLRYRPFQFIRSAP